MESVLGRYRNLTILVGVLFLQVLGLAVQVKRSADEQSTRLIRVWAVDLITPFERGLVWAQNGGNNVWRNYFFLRGVRAENRQLKEQIEQMRLEQVRLSEDATQAHRLQSLLAFKEQFIAKTEPAQVIGSSGSDLSQSIYIDKGSNAGILQDMAVITSGGIVGKVLRVYPSTSLVLMINDQSSGVGAMLEKSRLQGVVRGTPNGELILDRVMSDEEVTVGETLLSSGGDQIFPKGLPVGTVSKVSAGKEMFLSIKVKPAADLSRLEEVLVVTDKQERAPMAESAGRGRAADVLAQRLPSVPEKPATVPLATPPGTGAAANAAPGQGAGAGEKPQLNAAKIVVGTGATGEVVKKVVPKPAAADSVTNAGAGSGTGSSAALGVPAKPLLKTGSNAAVSVSPNATSNVGSNSSPKSTNSAEKPITAQPKPSNSQPSPQPPATEDGPH
jgi:rod shape-determining protein MreC